MGAFQITFLNQNLSRNTIDYGSVTYLNTVLTESCVIINIELYGKRVNVNNGLTAVEQMLYAGVLSIKDLTYNDFRRAGTTLLLDVTYYNAQTLNPVNSDMFSDLAQKPDIHKLLSSTSHQALLPAYIGQIGVGAISHGKGVYRFTNDVTVKLFSGADIFVKFGCYVLCDTIVSLASGTSVGYDGYRTD